MRLSIVILIAAMMQVSAATFGQRITLNEQRSAVENVLKKIRSQTGYDFLYDRQVIKDAGLIDLRLNNVTIEEALKAICKKKALVYSIEDKIVVLEPEKKSVLDKVIDLFSEIDIKGKVVDEQGKSLRGATVGIVVQDFFEDKKTGDFSNTVKGKKSVTITDENGEFVLKNIDEKAFIFISYTGYQTYTVKAAKTLFIKMKPDVNDLNQVQVIGYGAVSKRLNTATVSTVDAEVLAQQPVNNVLNALNGRMSGVTIVSGAGGIPGAGISVKIRGDNSLGQYGLSSSDPLYVIDGIPQASGSKYDSQNYSSGIRGMSGNTNMFSMLNIGDIEQIDVLKDADATSIYGARGANGVVVITTKKGKPGRMKLNLDLSAGAGRIGHYIPMFNTQQYLELRREAFRNEGITPDEENAPDLILWDQNAYTDYQRKFFGGTARQSSTNLTASGGNEFLNYYVGLNYQKEGTVMAKDLSVNRMGGKMNIGFSSLNQKFKAQISTNYTVEKSNLPVNASMMEKIYLPPNFPLYKPDGSLNWYNAFDNPLGLFLQKYKSTGTFLSATANLSYKPFDGFTVRTTAGYTLNGLENNSQVPASSVNPVFANTSNSFFTNSPNSNYTIEPQTEYTRRLGAGKLTALIGMTFSEAISKYTTLTGSNYTYDSQLGSISGAGIVNTLSKYDQYHYASLFSRLSYDLKQKYLLNISYRNDASSRFGPNNRTANFGSVGAAWIFSEEKWIKETVPVISFGKLKFSYGTTGNDRIDNYGYVRNYSNVYESYLDIRPLGAGDAANPDLKWESTRKLELSMNIGFLKDRFLLTTNIYRNRSSNMLNYTTLATQSGVQIFTGNLDAVVQNKGLELELNSKNLTGSNFTWNTSFNIAFERNVLISFKDQYKSIFANNFKVGEPADVASRLYYKYDGIDAATGVPLFKDLDGKPGLDANDLYAASLGHPFYGGINNSFAYKRISLDIFFKFEKKNGVVNTQPASTFSQILPGMMMNQNTDLFNRWQQAGDTGKKWPLAVTGLGTQSTELANLMASDFVWGDASYIRLKSVSLNYDLPSKWINKVGLQQLKLSLQGANLFSITKNKYMLDPEYGSSVYPALRTWVFGLNCTF